jgi:hypothetical protein
MAGMSREKVFRGMISQVGGLKAISFTKAEAIQTLRVDLQPLFGEGSSGGTFQVGFKIECLFAVGEGDGCFYAPGVNLEV